MASAGGSNPASANPAPTVQNIDIRVPKLSNKKLAIMRFNASIGVDFTKWDHPKLERENNQMQFKSLTEEMPKFGAGSEYGREQREEARRKKYGIISKKYKPEDQPWILQPVGKNGRKFRGVREGGVTENASYYVFTQAPDGAFEAFSVQEWYNFQAFQSYKALSYEEAEEEFNSRNRTFNLFNVMVRKRMKKDEEGDDDGEEEGGSKKKGKAKKGRDPMFGDELDEMESSDGDSSNGENGEDEDGGASKKKKKGKKPTKPKKRKNASDDEAFEDSDDGDGEGRELDYISSSDGESDSDLETKVKDELKGVAEEDALRKLLNSDEEDEDEEKPPEDENKEEEENDEDRPPIDKSAKDDKGEKKKKKEKKKATNKDKKPRKEDYGSSSDSSDESSSSELDKPKPSPKMKPGSASSSRSATPTKPGLSMQDITPDTKKKGGSEVSIAQAAKKARLDATPAASSSTSNTSPTPSSSAGSNDVNEEAVRRYLSRKPMTTTELLQKFKSKKTTLTSEQLVSQIAQILKKINPNKQMIKQKMYLSIKE